MLPGFPSFQMIRVLVICLSKQRLADQLFLAESLRTKTEVDFLFVCSVEIPSTISTRILERGFRAVLLDPSGNITEIKWKDVHISAPEKNRNLLQIRSAKWIGWTRKHLKAYAQWTTLSQIILAYRLTRRLRRLKVGAVQVIAEYRPNLVLAIGDRHGDIEAVISKTAQEKCIPIIVPYMAYSDRSSLVRQRKGNFLYSNPIHSPLYYKWVYWKHRDMILDGILYNLPYQIGVYQKFGTQPTNSWALGCGISDIICVENRSTYERYLSYGVNALKLRIIGDTSYDMLFKQYREKDAIAERLKIQYGFRDGRKTILIALPQLAEHDLIPWDSHFSDIEFIMETLSSLDQNVAVSLHPRQDRDRYAYLEEKYACSILDGRLAEWLPAADLFLATFSSTIIWAVLCGIPTVVVDFIELNSGMIKNLTSPTVVNKREVLRDTLTANLNEGRDFTQDWNTLSRDLVFDGHTVERYAKLFEELASSGVS
jgi:hypothetical protein